MWEDHHDNLHREYMVEMKDQGKWQDKAIDNVVLQLDYIEQLKENKALVATTQEYKELVASAGRCVEHLKETVKYQSELIELSKKARNPNRVTGGKRARPQGPKSKAVTFGAEAMPDNELVTFGTAVEFEAALMQ
jgi:hypothetical protein